MKIQCLQHAAFEGPGNLESWAKNKGHKFSKTILYYEEDLPKMSDFDLVFILGGPMSVNETKEYPWLNAEKAFVKEAIKNDKAVVGICLGAQLIAEALGSKVTKAGHKEIGWHPVTLTPDAKGSPVFGSFPQKFTAFHWHGETFKTPSTAIKLAKSAACEDQAFEFNKKVLGLQFHLEFTDDGINRIIKNCREDMDGGKFVMKEADMKSRNEYLAETRGLMDSMLDNMDKLVNKN
jgi:GMP synthase-like glutamine amidotransferase